jgi:hypothetical protein
MEAKVPVSYAGSGAHVDQSQVLFVEDRFNMVTTRGSRFMGCASYVW